MEKSKPKLSILDFDYKDVKGTGRFNSKSEFELTQKRMQRFDDLLIYRRTGCFWAPVPVSPEISLQDIMTYNDGSTKEGGSTGSNWNHRWNFNTKAFIAWKRYLQEYSNVKSSIGYGVVQAFMSQFSASNQSVSLYPESTDDEYIEVLEEYLRKLEINGNFTAAKKLTAQGCCVVGTAITFNPYLRKIRKNDVVLGGSEAEKYLTELMNSDDESDHKKAEDLKIKLDKNKPIVKELEFIDYEDPAIINESIFDFYPDDKCLTINGLDGEANDCALRKIKDVELVKFELENSNDPFIIKQNIKKIIDAQSVSSKYGETEQFFKTPSDLKNTKNKCVELNMYNRREKKWETFINETLIREGPLPYDSGLLPFTDYTFRKLDNQFYGISFMDMVESYMALDEMGLNMHVESRKVSENPPMIVNENIFPSIDEQYTRIEPRQIIRADGPVGEDNLRWFEGPSSNVMDLTSFRNMISDDATRITGINDLAYASVQPNEAVRNNMQAMQATNQIIKDMIENWAEGYKKTIIQVLGILKQKMPEKLENEDNQDILFEGVKFEDTNKGSIKRVNADGSHPFTLKPEHFNYVKDPRIVIDTDSLLPMSENVLTQRSEMVMTPQIMGMLINPQFQTNPLTLAIERDFFKRHNYGPEILNMFQAPDNGKQDVDDAMEDMTNIVNGKNVAGVPGRSQLHVATEANIAFDIMLEINGQESKNPLAEKALKSGADLREILQAILEHINTDKIPPQFETDALMSMQQQQPQNGATMPPQAPQGAPQASTPATPMATPQGQMSIPAQQGNAPQGGMQ